MNFRRWVLAGGAAAALAAAACTPPPPDYLFVDPRAQPVRVELRKAFGTWSKQYAAVPITECVFYETPKARAAEPEYPNEIWRVLSLAPDRPVLDLRYGTLPPGFVQATPVSLPAPPLEPGHRYSVECSGDTTGTTEFEIPEVVPQATPSLRPRHQTARSTPPPDDPRARGSYP
ncbi:MAG TPA: hypothetical protein VLF14_00460 [Candidatus Binatia bacterium]|nr:hypothetical protein [Candidatus Binatia bacterium]